ncbi:2,3-dihydroxybenzoate-AMP ligase [Streptomyces spiroverticillatus]|uniref:2,3-dihydroxybenzoate-AMP ligase n=1 Tax=Streptomyces finlayi TaxID=67296 RepID=A0A918X4F9_9ACTN|nr:AMP-binding protein [Streptomyces finlayi]GHA31707.1 2,3-dihydroxybenzoate-AMP ligase [Streptomyces spiroverticillatus]GHD10941.1 2,3-dihydroxybenzoate-AMP ligase [Streptomyces finlayi]
MMLDGCTPWPAETAAHYRRTGLWRGSDLGALPREWAAAYGSATALVSGDTRISYTELADRVDRRAAGFVREGVRPGDRIVLQLPNVPEFVEVAFALFRAGAKPVFSLTSHRSQEIRHLCELSGASGYVVPGVFRGFDHVALGRQIAAGLPALRTVFVMDAVEEAEGSDGGRVDVVPLARVDGDPQPLPANDPSDVAFFLLSGGTTALPKLIPRTHDDYAYQTRTVAELLSLDPASVYLAVLPVEFNFTWGCPGVVGTLASGGTVVLAPDPTADDCFALIERERVTLTSVVPTVARLWLEEREFSDRDLSSLEVLQIGGARLEPELAARIAPELGCRLQQVFGMAEGLLTMSRPGDDPHSVLHTQGRPVSEADEVRIVDEQGDPVPPGGVGELLTRGPYTLRGYYRAPEHNARAFTEDGFYRTGDLASITPEGRLVVEGRIKDVVIRGGDKIAAGEVEAHLLAVSGIAAAAVVPVPDAFLGERIYAFLVGRDDSAQEPPLTALKAALQQRGLADYKLPDRAEYVPRLPLTPLGKIDKKVLAAAAADPARSRDWARVRQDPQSPRRTAGATAPAATPTPVR